VFQAGSLSQIARHQWLSKKRGTMEPPKCVPGRPLARMWEALLASSRLFSYHDHRQVSCQEKPIPMVSLILTLRVYFIRCWAGALRLLLPSTEISFRSRCSSQLIWPNLHLILDRMNLASPDRLEFVCVFLNVPTGSVTNECGDPQTQPAG
jgi:hypothetical protein